jgi:folate-binding protein YgfZ
MSFLFCSNRLTETSSVLRIRGSDAYTYLQGQFTQDLNHPSGSSGYGLWLNQRGKVVADSFILRRADNDFIAASYDTKLTLLRERLESYIVADEVELVDETGEWAWLTLWGEGSSAQLVTIFGSAPAPGRFVGNQLGLVFPGRISGGENFACLSPRASASNLVEKLVAAGAQPGGRDAMERERILSGIPAVPADLGSGDLPNEGGLEETAISHTKGCYLGQEVMARLKNLGQVRRHLHIVRGAGAAPFPLTALFQAGKKIGEIRSAAPEGGGFVAMALLMLMNLDPAAGLATAADGPATLEIVRRV